MSESSKGKDSHKKRKGGKPSKQSGDNSPALTLPAEQTPAPSVDILNSERINAKGREEATLGEGSVSSLGSESRHARVRSGQAKATRKPSSSGDNFQSMFSNMEGMMTQMMQGISHLTDRVSDIENMQHRYEDRERQRELQEYNRGRFPEEPKDDEIASHASGSSGSRKNKRGKDNKSKSSIKKKDARRYSTLDDLVSHREVRHRLPFDEESNGENDSPIGMVPGAAQETPWDKSKKATGKLLKELKRSTEAVSDQQVIVMRKEKECHITIDKFQLSKVAKAIRDIMDFQEEEQTTVRVQKVLSRQLKHHLLVKYNKSPADLAVMDIDDLFGIIAMETKVYSSVAFYEELKQSLAHSYVMDWSKVSAVNFEVFYFQQLKLIDNFKRMLQIMLVCNQRWCPRVDDKEYGLIRLFKSLNDPYYVKYAFGCMPSLKFDKMDEFFVEFQKTLLDHYETSLVYREFPFMNNIQHKNKLKDFHEKKRQSSYQEKSGKTAYKSNHVSHVRMKDSDEESLDPYDLDIMSDEDMPELKGDSDDESVTDEVTKPLSTTSDKEESSRPEKVLEPTEGDDLLAVMQGQSSDKPREAYGCMKKMLHGKCDRIGCKYSHNESAMLKTARDMKEKLDAYLKSHSGQQARPQHPSVLRRDHPGDSRP